uniref:granzyme B(G,H)-like isoform X2 n=1 Tax=Scatophagus argus TaxID=75038 RepID=UPI001ED8349A|nr:granzyme B(G,H)-like isoform X2 [Scatophagus argus]XP_046248478.1 granzyme B(G,H)-like isoform X3 [Scatophagus argus]
MLILCKLVILILALTLDGHVHAGEIIGGHKAVPHSRPYMVILERKMNDGKTKYCDGFLLNEDFVMTAAHCQASNYTVLLGVHDFHEQNGVQRVFVKDAFPHEDNNATEFSNDIMLLKLSSKAKLSQNVKPIVLAGQNDDSLPQSCIVSGWGSTADNNGYPSPVLMEVNVTLVDFKPCAEKHLYCSLGEKGPGSGDSGGPLVCEDGIAYGVVSYSIKTIAGDQKIYCYTKIPDYINWIKQTVKMHD